MKKKKKKKKMHRYTGKSGLSLFSYGQTSLSIQGCSDQCLILLHELDFLASSGVSGGSSPVIVIPPVDKVVSQDRDTSAAFECVVNAR